MKKALSIIMCIILFALTAIPAFSKEEKTTEPVIMVAGYSSSKLKMTDSEGNVEDAWGGIDFGKIISYLFHYILSDKDALKNLTDFSKEQIIENVSGAIVDLFGHLALDENGNSINNIDTYLTNAENSSTKKLIDDGNERFVTEPEIQARIAQEAGGYDNLYTFNVDFRMGTVFCAEKLDRFIDDVLEYTGSSKVRLYAVSHGGQTVATYLSLYGEKQCVSKAVLTVPAIGGAGLAYDIMSGKAALDEENLFRFVEHGMMFESDFEWLVQNHPFDNLDEIIKGLLPALYQVIGNWGSIWDFIPKDYYDEVKALRLDEEKNAGIIEKSDYVHYVLMPNFGEALEKARNEYGVDVNIIAGTDNTITTGLKENSDGIITVNSSTGAKCAPFGMRFSDGYISANRDNTYVSPSMTIDASTGYLPDNTWYVEGLFHGMTVKDEYSMSLALKLLMTDELKDINSSAEYPQFRPTSNVSSSVIFGFDNAENGIINSCNKVLTIKNLSEKHSMSILAVNAKGLGDISFILPEKTKLAPGESISIEYKGELKKASKTTGEVTVSYFLSGSVTPLNERTIYFALNNGEAAEYDCGNPYTPEGVYSDLSMAERIYTEKLTDLWFAKLIKLLVNIITFVFSSL